ncbi:MAG: hypothetical protein LRS47_01650, partial [Desulfurococcales archaeon]|nr:hypothetical protein [Desulfurococcales archaeon]
MRIAYGVVLLVIALAGLFMFSSSYESIAKTDKDYRTLCGMEFNYPIRASTLVYKLDYNNTGVFSSHGTIRLEVKPSQAYTCSSPILYLGITASDWYNGTPVTWEAGSVVPPRFVLMGLHPLPASYANATFAPDLLTGGLLANMGKEPVQTVGGEWTAYHFIPVGNNVVVHPVYGDIYVKTDVYYDANTLIPVYSTLHIDIPKINQSMDYTIQLVSHSNKLQTRAYSIAITGIVAGIALALGVKDVL